MSICDRQLLVRQPISVLVRLVLTVIVVAIVSVMPIIIDANHSAFAQSPNLGQELSLSDLKRLPAHVFPDGTGLPEGSGSSVTGKALYAQHCSACHGGRGEGGTALELVGDRTSLNTEYPDRGIAVFWPYAPTLFEYIRRSMPPDKPWSLSPDDVYAIIAWLLEINELIPAGTQIDKASLSVIRMPNRDGFVDPGDH